MSSQPTPPIGRRTRLLLAIVLIGLVLGAIQPYGVDELLDLGHRWAEQPAYLVIVVAGMALMFTFGLPGSLGVWLIAPFQPPLIATGLLLAGSTMGSLGAYLFSSRFRERTLPEGFARRVLDLLSRHGGIPTQTGLRILPGFPHSVVNFAGGLLGLPLPGYMTAAIVGMAIKWGVYASAVHEIFEVVEDERALGWDTGAPLLVLAMLVFIGVWARHRLAVNRPAHHQ